MPRYTAASKIGNSVISLLWQLWCRCNPNHNKFSSLSDTTVVAIFPNLCLWRLSLWSNLGGIDPEKLYRATLRKEFTRPIAKSTSPGLSDTTFFARWLELLSPAPQATLTLSFMLSKRPAYSVSQHTCMQADAWTNIFIVKCWRWSHRSEVVGWWRFDYNIQLMNVYSQKPIQIEILRTMSNLRLMKVQEFKVKDTRTFTLNLPIQALI